MVTVLTLCCNRLGLIRSPREGQWVEILVESTKKQMDGFSVEWINRNSGQCGAGAENFLDSHGDKLGTSSMDMVAKVRVGMHGAKPQNSRSPFALVSDPELSSDPTWDSPPEQIGEAECNEGDLSGMEKGIWDSDIGSLGTNLGDQWGQVSDLLVLGFRVTSSPVVLKYS